MAEEDTAGRADDPQQRQEDDQQDEGGAQVVAEHHQHGQDADPGQQRDEQLPPVTQLAQLVLAGQQVGAPQQERELGQLGRLELDAAELDPAGRAALRLAHDQHQDQAEQRTEHQRVGGGPEPARRGMRRQPHAGQPDQHAEQLVLQAGPGRNALHQPERRRRGQHHDQAERQQQRGQAEHQVERGERPVQEAEPGGHPVPGVASPGCRADGLPRRAQPGLRGRAHRRAAGRRAAGTVRAAGRDRLMIPVSPPAAATDADICRVSRGRLTWASTPRRRRPGRARRTSLRSART